MHENNVGARKSRTREGDKALSRDSLVRLVLFCFLGPLRKLVRYHLFFFQTFAMAQVFLLLFGSVFLVLSSSQKMSPKCLELYKRKTNGCSVPLGAWVPYKRTFTSRCYKHDICYTCVRITCFVNINNSLICRELSLCWKPIVPSWQSVNETNLARLKNRSSESLKEGSKGGVMVPFTHKFLQISHITLVINQYSRFRNLTC